MAHFNVYLVLGLDAKLLLLGLVFIIGQNYAVDVQKCGIDEYFQRDLEMCKPCTEVCRPGDRSCEKICPCFVIQKKLKEGLRNYKLLQTQNSELAASKEILQKQNSELAASKEILQKQNSELAASKEILQKQNSELAASKERWRLAVILISTLFAMFILAAGIIWKLWMPKKQSEHNGRRPQPAEENNVTSRFAPSGKAPPSPDVVPDNECFPMLRLNREEGSEQQRDAGQRGDMDQQTYIKHTSNGQETDTGFTDTLPPRPS